MKYNALYGQSGGPTSVINASLYGVITSCKQSQEIETLFLMHHGIQGLLNEDLLDAKMIPEEQIELLKQTPGSILGTIRYQLDKPTLESKVYQTILAIFKKYHIRYFFYNGGNDSMDTCNKIAEYFSMVHYECKVIGIPKTIDNDLVGTDHTPGFGTSINFIVQAMQSIYNDNLSYPKGRVNIVEIMGRDTGWLTAATKLGDLTSQGPDLIYVPEVPFSEEQFLKDVQKIYNQKKRVLVAVSEGIKDAQGNFISNNQTLDVFNHKALGGVSEYLALKIESKLSISTRAIVLSLLQRSFISSLSKLDLQEAIMVGKKAVEFALLGRSDVMVSLKRVKEYEIEYDVVPLKDVANKVSYLPQEMISASKNQINEQYITYAKPFLNGPLALQEKDGMILYADYSKFFVSFTKAKGDRPQNFLNAAEK